MHVLAVQLQKGGHSDNGHVFQPYLVEYEAFLLQFRSEAAAYKIYIAAAAYTLAAADYSFCNQFPFFFASFHVCFFTFSKKNQLYGWVDQKYK
jgi:hypothetical protein